MKIEKGQLGYIKALKKKETIKTIIAFALVLVLLITGIVTTGTKLNWFTLIAILGCLPAAKVLVAVITLFPHKPMEEEKAAEVADKTEYLTVIYDMVITSREKVMSIDCAVISEFTVCGYTHNEKANLEYTAKYLKRMLGQNRCGNVSVKIFSDYKAFITRAEGMNNMAAIESVKGNSEKEGRIRDVILSLSF